MRNILFCLSILRIQLVHNWYNADDYLRGSSSKDIMRLLTIDDLATDDGRTLRGVGSDLFSSSSSEDGNTTFILEPTPGDGLDFAFLAVSWEDIRSAKEGAVAAAVAEAVTGALAGA